MLNNRYTTSTGGESNGWPWLSLGVSIIYTQLKQMVQLLIYHSFNGDKTQAWTWISSHKCEKSPRTVLYLLHLPFIFSLLLFYFIQISSGKFVVRQKRAPKAILIPSFATIKAPCIPSGINKTSCIAGLCPIAFWKRFKIGCSIGFREKPNNL